MPPHVARCPHYWFCGFVLCRGLFLGLVQLHGCVLAVAFGNINRLCPMACLAWLGQAGESDVVDLARHGVSDVPVLRVTTAIAVFILGVDADVGNFQVRVPFDYSVITFIYAFLEHLVCYIQLLHRLLHHVAPTLELTRLDGAPRRGGPLFDKVSRAQTAESSPLDDSLGTENDDLDILGASFGHCSSQKLGS